MLNSVDRADGSGKSSGAASVQSSGVSSASPPAISLPKGGGAIRGIGEKFAANPVTGTGSMTVPIAISPGRSGFGPQLSLAYDSGSGNGPFGFGWSLSLPQITRKTDKGLPRYDDAAESDVFLLSGAEDLVPVLIRNNAGKWEPEKLPVRTIDGRTYTIKRYRPRIEGLFARIERWTRDDGDVHWRSISKDNILTLYGKDANSRIADPDEARRIFSWLICETRDDRGNAILYEYKAENAAKLLNVVRAHEANRGDSNDARRKANRYIKHIRYGNRKPLLDARGKRPAFLNPAQINNAGWMFEVVFDYGEHDAKVPTPDDSGDWSRRNDPFSSYRAGFEVRTCRLCERVLMFHHFPGVRGVRANCLVRSTDFEYSHEQNPTAARDPIYSILISVTQRGYVRDGAAYLERSLPPVAFEYTRPIVQSVVEEVDAASLENLPVGLNGGYQWTDLHGEGIPGILTEQGDGWFYKRNLSPINLQDHNGVKHLEAQFAPVELVASKPNLSLGGGAQFMDLAGDGQPDLVVLDGALPGLYEHDDAESWEPFRPFTARLNRAMNDLNLKFVDLDGDGRADVLITEDNAFLWHPSLAEEGFGPARRVAQAFDEEKGPRLVFADGEQSIYLADLSGDRLTDICRIRNGEICYWPNLGYGRFGAKITMDNAPMFDNPDQFDQRRVRLADIDGSGTTDIIYLHRDGVCLYFNQSGNGWSLPQMLDVFPFVDNLTDITATDLLGNGTACLVWSSPLPGDMRRPMRYVNLMGDEKPHLLVGVVNNLGAETRVRYAPSTKFYLADRLAGRPWITRLPFPVHVVERVETHDHVSRNRFVTTYAYHHGYFDGEEQEFRGFGMVEQRDTLALVVLAATGTLPPGDNESAASHVPPVLTRTWFHTGVYLGRDHISNFFAGLLAPGTSGDRGEYYREPAWLVNDDEAKKHLLPDTILPDGLTLDEERQAARALKGMMLRQEIYALDGIGSDDDYPNGHPYTVAEQNFTVRLLQPQGLNRHAVFFTHTREALTYHYEREPADPRIQHALTLEVDKYGNVLKSAAVGYGRRTSRLPRQWDRDRQTTTLITYTENDVTDAIDDLATHLDDHRTPLPAETRTYELTGYPLTSPAMRYRADDFVTPDPRDPKRLIHLRDGETDYEKVPPAGKQRRLIEHVRTLYRPDDCGVAQNDPLALLALRTLEPLALPGENYKLALTPGLLQKVYKRKHPGQPDEDLRPANLAVLLTGQGVDEGGYVAMDGGWWIPSGRMFYHSGRVTAPVELAEAQANFFLPRRFTDPFGHDTTIDYDAPLNTTLPRYNLLMTRTEDALQNEVYAENDYRVLQPWRITDPNRNRTEVAFDALGLVVATAVKGKPRANVGDLLQSAGGSLLQADLMQAELWAFHSDPHAAKSGLLGRATSRIVYDLNRWSREGLPAYAATLARETHFRDPGGPQSKIQVTFSYSDGFGREIQKKIQAEKGPTPQRRPDGRIRVGPDRQPVMTPGDTDPRWVGSGWTIFNNKGRPVRQYEPFFSDTHEFEFGVEVGVSPILFYDPAERVVATLHPNNTWEKVIFDPWRQETWDVNDTVAGTDPVTGAAVTLDPRTDPDVGGFFARLPTAEHRPTWYEQRTALAANDPERVAADKAAVHRQTPTVAHFDALGRPFLTVAHNRFERNGATIEEFYATRVELDTEGNQRAVRDAVMQAGDPLGRVVMRYDYDMLGNRIHQASMEAGERWMLNDATGKPIRAWDSRGHNFTTKYDALRRPIEQTVRGTTADSDPRTRQAVPLLIDKIEYGEPLPNPTPAQEALAQRLNLRTRIYRHSDSAGIVTNARLDTSGNPTDAYDFRGNLMHSTRQLVSDYKAIPDWSQKPSLDSETFENSTRYDALNRPIQAVAPHSSVTRAGRRNKFNIVQPVYNEANLLEQVHVWLEQSAEPAGPPDPNSASPVGVADIDYDAKGQRLHIDYKNGASTVYSYDPQTFRLTQMLTKRKAADFPGDDPQPPVAGWPGKQVQNLHYTYDPAGNITHIRDDAQQTIYFKNQRVEPSNDYAYDALHRLIQATGREHLGQVGGVPIPHSHNDAGRVSLVSANAAGQFAPNDGRAMARYCEKYVYDAVGNFVTMSHRDTCSSAASWTRAYDYLETSLIEDGRNGAPRKFSNRLSQTMLNPAGNTTQPETYQHDAHGNMTRMSHLPLMQWDYRDQLQATSQQVVTNGGTPEITYYVYNAAGQRVRKVTERQAAAGQTTTRMRERIYLGGSEFYRDYDSSGANPTLERETLHVMDDKQRIALVETRTLGSDQAPRQLIRYQFGNHLGSASLELDSQAQIISYEEYAPYGSSTYQAVRSQTEEAKRYRYTGMERDEESGINYHAARYFAEWIARWISPDPKEVSDCLCVYSYAHANPIANSDISGASTAVHANQYSTTLLSDEDLGVPANGVSPDELADRFAGGLIGSAGSAFKIDLLPDEAAPQNNDISGGTPDAAIRSSPEPLREDPVSGFTGGEVGSSQFVYQAPSESTGFWNRGGKALSFGLLSLVGGALILASGPAGWLALAGTFAAAGGGAATLFGGVHLSLSYSGSLSSQQEAEMRLGGEFALATTSPGSILGMTAAAPFSGGDPEAVLYGAAMGGLGEGAIALSLNGRRMLATELEHGVPPGANWKERLAALQETFGYGNPATRARPNAAFPKGIERIELSHWIPKRLTRWAGAFFDRPWNLRPVWGTEHALMDAFRYNFMGTAWRAANPAYGSFTSFARLMPEWARGSMLGLTQAAINLRD